MEKKECDYEGALLKWCVQWCYEHTPEKIKNSLQKFKNKENDVSEKVLGDEIDGGWYVEYLVRPGFPLFGIGYFKKEMDCSGGCCRLTDDYGSFKNVLEFVDFEEEECIQAHYIEPDFELIGCLGDVKKAIEDGENIFLKIEENEVREILKSAREGGLLDDVDEKHILV